MGNQPSLWVVIPNILTTGFIFLTWLVYLAILQAMRNGNKILEETNRITRELGMQAAWNQQALHAPMVLLTFQHFGDKGGKDPNDKTTWRVVNIGKGDARDLRLFERGAGRWQQHRPGGAANVKLLKPQGSTTTVLDSHSRKLKPQDPEEKNRLSVIAVYFDEFNNRWASRFENGKYLEPQRLGPVNGKIES